MKQVLVTGASGFIGRKLCHVLQSQGVYVRAFLRSPVEGPWDAVILGDLKGSLSKDWLCDVDAVFHLAGKAHALAETKQDEEEYFQINTEATRKLLEVCKQQDVKKFVYFSSVKAVGDISAIMDEMVKVDADMPYGRSKFEAENLVLNGGYVPEPVVLRPTMVYGETLKGNLPKMIQAIANGHFPPLADVGNRRSMVHVDDVVRAALLVVDNPVAAGKIYIVTGAEPCSTRQLYEWICDALGKTIPGWRVPMAVLMLLGFLGDIIGNIRGARFIFNSDALDKLVGSAHYSSERIQYDLGYESQRTLKNSLPKIIEWMRKQGAL